MKTLLLIFSITGCTQQTEAPASATPEIQESSSLAEESLNKSVKSLDRTIKMMDKMVDDLDRMNNNLDAIFRAITDCKSDQECRTLRNEYVRQYEENKSQ